MHCCSTLISIKLQKTVPQPNAAYSKLLHLTMIFSKLNLLSGPG